MVLLLLISAGGNLCLMADERPETDIQAEAALPGKGEKHVLVLFSYTTSWVSERDVLHGLTSNMIPSVRLDTVFMDTKNIGMEQAEKITEEHVRLLKDKIRYDAIVAIDDDALNFVLKKRNEWFAGIPVVFNNINSRDIAERAVEDPLITGIYETFFGAETVEAARVIYPKAVRVVGLSDHSPTGLAVNERFMELKDSIDLDFELLDMMELSRDEIVGKISSYGDDTILMYLNFTQDKDGNIYGLDESYRFITDITKLPLFRPDQIGIGMGVLGGCGGSFAEAGERTARILMDVLNGEDISGMGVLDMEGQYVFDASLLGRYGVSKSKLPAGTLFVNQKKSFWKEYSFVLMPVIVIILLLVIIVVLLAADRRRLESLLSSRRKLSDSEIRRRRAESQSSAVGKFLSSVSHDLRTPLSSIIGYTDMAISETDEEKRTDYLEKIRSSGELLTGIVSDTLDVSRILSGKTRINPVPTTMDKVSASVISSVSETARKKRVRFYSSVQDGSLLIRVDQMKLQRIILNLLTNAVKYTPEGGQVTLEIEHLEERVNGCNFKICVTDTGVGISRDFQKIMFEPFMQEKVDPLKSGAREGTGLGLTIVRSNVEQMGGFIDLRSEEGAGTSISVFLPIDVREGECEESIEPETRNFSKLAGMKVLVAEDSDMNREVARAVLAGKKIECVCVSDGRQAVEAFETSPAGTFDAILMDLRMPVMDGYEAASRIRSLKREDAASIPIYALSADVYDEDKKKVQDAGMNGHISKPIRPEKLYDALMGLNIP